MGYKYGEEPSKEICELIEISYKELCKVITPKYIYKEYDFTRTEDGIVIDGIEFKSQKLLNHLRNSASIILFGATIGVGADTLVRKYSVTDIAMTSVAHCVGASLVENLCDMACEELKNEIKGEHRPRFSPGYGDLPLECQKNIVEFLQTKKNIGMSLTESLMMVPVKSVTAIIGIGKEKNKCTGPGCMICKKADCPYR